MNDVSSLCNDTKEVVRELNSVLLNIRKQTIHSLIGCYFKGNIGFNPNAAINILNTMVEEDRTRIQNIHIQGFSPLREVVSTTQ